MNSFHDVFMVIGGTIGVLLNLSAFVLMSTYTCTKYCHFKAIIKYLRLVDGLGAVMLGIMVEGQFIPGVNLVSSHGVCQRLNSDVCAKITYATCVNVTLIIIGSVTFMNLMRYNVFFRKAELLTTSTYDKIIFSCVMIIGPIGVFATCYDLQIYKENDVSSFQLDASDLEDVRHYFGPEYTLLGIFTTNKLNMFSFAISFIVISSLVVFMTGIYYYICIEWSLKQAKKQVLKDTANKISDVISHLRFLNATLIIFCFLPIIFPMLLLILNLPTFLKPITSNILIFIMNYILFIPIFSTYHYYKEEIKKFLNRNLKILPYTNPTNVST